ncbi:conserved phage C-terminal domain-containing protein [Leclercia pneumoniae]|uniref:conserved phage C-terminal domain-containing protein n=1 Tax=Leclercia pneumoniae TaxID=2815358 RepID=UPI0021E560F2|nr:conserved phage C-terminal domain-containing protein [Leclercia pneumoniae]MCV2510178.1 conserved phage C-terminal domain-containing protein [Leclercia pneumoniae]WNN79733.1 conserved phage C-terminal domain-containing protein [Leclercia pneumoniae]
MSRIFDIVQSMSGQKNVIVLPRPYLQFFKEDQQAHALAAVLNNLVFWSAFGSEDGWFYKTHKELGAEAGELTEDQTERLVKKLITKYLPGVIETCSRKVNGTPTKHYRIDGDALISLIFPENDDSVKVRNKKRESTELKTRICGSQSANNRNHGIRESTESYLYTDFNAELNKQTNKPSCPVASQPDPEVTITDNAILVLTHLNQVSGSRYQKSKTSLENIRARLREGYSVHDLQLVIDLKHEHWNGNDDQYQYMRPETLFGPKKFEGYLQSATRWESKGRPKRQEWEGQRQLTAMNFGPVDTSIPAGFRGAKS